MRLIKGMAGFFGYSSTHKRKKTHSQEEINLMDAINAHVKCKMTLQNYFKGTAQEPLDPVNICRDDQCELGVWIHGPAFRHFNENPSFYQLRAFHAQCHVIAGRVVAHVLANDRAAAEVLMEGSYKDSSRRVVKALTELNRPAS